MNAPAYEHGTCEAAMRAVLLVQRKAIAPMLVCEIADLLRDELGFSRSTSFRYARMASDVLCLPVLSDGQAGLRRGDRSEAGKNAIRSLRA